jgi:NADPH:quinone reductase-like Zn-dependent oxidoreductase
LKQFKIRNALKFISLTNMPSNRAAWLVAKGAKPFQVGPAPYTSPGEHEIVVKNAAVAINPADWKVQDAMVPFPLNYPTIIGADVAGVVAEVGTSVTRFRVGDRVLGYASGIVSQRTGENGFQEYTVISDNLSSPIPNSLSFEAAAVIPLGFSTVAFGMYEKDYLGLQYPSLSPKPTGQVLLIWGGATSLGSNAIQLGVASGYEVITTASVQNFEYVKRLGASQVFDYKNETIVEDLIDALKGKSIAGVLDNIGAVEVCAEILRRSQGQKFIATAVGAPGEQPGGIKVNRIIAPSFKDKEAASFVFKEYLPKALEEGKFVPAPDPVVVGKGLHAIQDGVDVLRKGVSAKKVVVTL